MAMGIRDWFTKKEQVPEEPEKEAEIELPVLDKESLFEETMEALSGDNVEPEEELVIETVPEYDSGDVEIDELLSEEMDSNYELNTVEEVEIEDMLESAEIIGDVPEEVDL